MSIWTSITGAIGKVLGAGVVDTVSKGADIVERWAPGVEKKAEIALDIDKQIETAASNARTTAGPVGAGGWLGLFADGLNRLIRPGVTIGFLGGLFGWWTLPKPDAIDPLILGWIENVLYFWFGGRVLLKDLPSVINYLRKK